jgi:hypothetical protein
MQLFGDSDHYNNLRQKLPPPPLESLYHPLSSQNVTDVESNSYQRKRSLNVVNSWDSPLQKPKIRGRSESKSGVQIPQLANNDVALDQWIGVVGLDMWQNSRARPIYTQNRSITPQHFIFPICHDSYVYGRIREVQASKVNVLEPILRDTTVWDVIRTEGKLQREEILRSRRRIKRGKKKKREADAKRAATNSDEDSDGNVEESDPEEDDTPTWPGLDRLLPANRLNPVT